jgi:hypothetical protein
VPAQDPPVVVHAPLPVEVFAVAGLPRLATPVVASTVMDWSPAPVAVVCAVPSP